MKKTVYIVGIMLVLIVNLLTVSVRAEDLTFTATMKASSTNVGLGKEFIVKISVDKFESAKDGIHQVVANLSYDEDVFEINVEDGESGPNNWKVNEYKDKKLTLINTKSAKTKQDIAELSFKVKKDTTSKKGTIELSNIVAKDSEGSELVAEDVKLEINISEEEETNTTGIRTITSNTNTENTGIRTITGNTNTDNTNTNTANTNTNTNTENVSNYSKNETQKEKMPETGLDDSIVKAMILVALVGVFGYIKFKSIEK